MADWLVAIEQRRPYEFVQIEVFLEEADALDYAARYARGHGAVQLSRRRWRLPDDNNQRLIVWRRT